MPDLARDVKALLGRYMSPISAKSILDLSVTWADVNLAHMGRADVARLLTEMDKGIQLYVRRPDLHRECLERLSTLLSSNGDGSAPPREEPRASIDVRAEDDVVTARNFGRDVCQRLGFSLTVQIQIATAISELARNIIQYAGHGVITIAVVGEEQRGIEIVARDDGPGIADLETVLSGRYQSRTGMGIGLLGTKRLMDEFAVRTAPGAGTEVVARMFPA